MVRETRHLWVGNLPDNVREERIREHFQRYGRVQSVKLLGGIKDETVSPGIGSIGGMGVSSGGLCATVAFMDIKSAAKAHAADNTLEERTLHTDYYEPPLHEEGGTGPNTPTVASPAPSNGSSVGGCAAGLGTSNSNGPVAGGMGANTGINSTGVVSSGTGNSTGINGGSPVATPRTPLSNNASGSVGGAGLPGNAHFPPRSPRFPHGPGEDYDRSSHFFGREGESPHSHPPPYLRRGGYHHSSHRERNTYRNGSYSSHYRNWGGGNGSYRTGGGGLPLNDDPRSTTDSNHKTLNVKGSHSTTTPPTSALGTAGSAGGGTERTTERPVTLGAGLSGGGSSSKSKTARSAGSDSGSESRSRSSPSRSPSPHSSPSRSRSRSRGSRSRSRTPVSRSRSRSLPRTRSRSPSTRSTSRSRSSSSSRSRSSRSARSSISRSPASLGLTPHPHGPPRASTNRQRVQRTLSTPPLAICVRNLPLRSSDTSLKDGLFHEYKKHGKVVSVKVAGQGADRVAVVCFKKPEDVDKALEVSRDKLFFGCKIEVTPCDDLDLDDNEFRPLEAELDEYHPKATRTLFIGNLEKDITASELRQHFERFGPIIEIDVKKQTSSNGGSGTTGGSGTGGSGLATGTASSLAIGLGGAGTGGLVVGIGGAGGGTSNSSTGSGSSSTGSGAGAGNNAPGGTSYAFCQYADIASVVRAMRHMDGEQLGNTRVKLGFGKSMPTSCVWMHGIGDSVTEKFLARAMSRYGHVAYVAIDREKGNALVFYEQVGCAQVAVQEMRGRSMLGRKLQVDFASRECQADFFENLDSKAVEREGSRYDSPRYTNRGRLAYSRGATTPRPPPPSSRGGRPRSYEEYSPAGHVPMDVEPYEEAAISPAPGYSPYSGRKSSTSNNGLSVVAGGEEDSGSDSVKRSGSKDLRDTLLERERERERERNRLDREVLKDKDTPKSGKERNRRLGSGGSNSSSGVSVEPHPNPMGTASDKEVSTPTTTTPQTPRTHNWNHHHHHSQSRKNSSSERQVSKEDPVVASTVPSVAVTPTFNPVGGGVSIPGGQSSGEEHSDADSGTATGPSLSKKAKLSSSDSGVSDVSAGGDVALPLSAPMTVAPPATPTLPTLGRPVSLTGTSKVGLAESKRRRSSDALRRPSTDDEGSGSAGKWVLVTSPRVIPPEPVWRRRKTEESSESRPGTPLCDEKPDDAPLDPRLKCVKVKPELPWHLPLPRFAGEALLRSLSGSRPGSPKPPQAVSNLTQPNPSQVSPLTHRNSEEGGELSVAVGGLGAGPGGAAPGSPQLVVPPQALTHSTEGGVGGVVGEEKTMAAPGNSESDSEESSPSTSPKPPKATAAGPSLAERLKQLDLRYEMWSARSVGSYNTSSCTSPTSNSLELRRKPRPIEELQSSQPSDIVRSLLAKRSVFDEDLKRLENCHQKYDPNAIVPPNTTRPATPTSGSTLPVTKPQPLLTTCPTSSTNSSASPYRQHKPVISRAVSLITTPISIAVAAPLPSKSELLVKSVSLDTSLPKTAPVPLAIDTNHSSNNTWAMPSNATVSPKSILLCSPRTTAPPRTESEVAKTEVAKSDTPEAPAEVQTPQLPPELIKVKTEPDSGPEIPRVESLKPEAIVKQELPEVETMEIDSQPTSSPEEPEAESIPSVSLPLPLPKQETSPLQPISIVTTPLLCETNAMPSPRPRKDSNKEKSREVKVVKDEIVKKDKVTRESNNNNTTSVGSKSGLLVPKPTTSSCPPHSPQVSKESRHSTTPVAKKERENTPVLTAAAKDPVKPAPSVASTPVTPTTHLVKKEKEATPLRRESRHESRDSETSSENWASSNPAAVKRRRRSSGEAVEGKKFKLESSSCSSSSGSVSRDKSGERKSKEKDKEHRKEKDKNREKSKERDRDKSREKEKKEKSKDKPPSSSSFKKPDASKRESDEDRKKRRESTDSQPASSKKSEEHVRRPSSEREKSHKEEKKVKEHKKSTSEEKEKSREEKEKRKDKKKMKSAKKMGEENSPPRLHLAPPPLPQRRKSRDANSDASSDSCQEEEGEDGLTAEEKKLLAPFLENEPIYMSMYDKVKARSSRMRNTQAPQSKPPLELKDKFNQLKMSRTGKSRDDHGKKIWDDDDSGDEDDFGDEELFKSGRKVSAARSRLSSTSASDSGGAGSDLDVPLPSSRKSGLKGTVLGPKTPSRRPSRQADDSDSDLEAKGKIHAPSFPKKTPKRSSFLLSDEESELEEKRTKAIKDEEVDMEMSTEIKPKLNKEASEAEEKRAKLAKDDKKLKEKSKKKSRKSSSTSKHSSESTPVPSVHPATGTQAVPRKEDKMENIFGPLSDDSEEEAKKGVVCGSSKKTLPLPAIAKAHFSQIYRSDSESDPVLAKNSESDEKKAKKKANKGKERVNHPVNHPASLATLDTPLKTLVKEEVDSDGDDLVAAGKALESQLLLDEIPVEEPHFKKKKKSKKHKEDKEHKEREKVEKADKLEKAEKVEKEKVEREQTEKEKMEKEKKLTSELHVAIESEPAPKCTPSPALETLASPKSSVVSKGARKMVPEEPPPPAPEKVPSPVSHAELGLNMPSLLEPPPPATVPVPEEDVPAQPLKEEKPRTLASKEETEDAVAGLLSETFDFETGLETTDDIEPEDIEPPVVIHPAPPPEPVLPVQEDEALKAVQSLETEELIIDETPSVPSPPVETKEPSLEAWKLLLEEEDEAKTPVSASCAESSVSLGEPKEPTTPQDLQIDESKCGTEEEEDSGKDGPQKTAIQTKTSEIAAPEAAKDQTEDKMAAKEDAIVSPRPAGAALGKPHGIKAKEEEWEDAHKTAKKKAAQPRTNASQRGTGRRRAASRTVTNSETDDLHSSDVYEFHDDEDEDTVVATGGEEPKKEVNLNASKEELDRSSVDDVIEDVVKGKFEEACIPGVPAILPPVAMPLLVTSIIKTAPASIPHVATPIVTLAPPVMKVELPKQPPTEALPIRVPAPVLPMPTPSPPAPALQQQQQQQPPHQQQQSTPVSVINPTNLPYRELHISTSGPPTSHASIHSPLSVVTSQHGTTTNLVHLQHRDVTRLSSPNTFHREPHFGPHLPSPNHLPMQPSPRGVGEMHTWSRDPHHQATPPVQHVESHQMNATTVITTRPPVTVEPVRATPPADVTRHLPPATVLTPVPSRPASTLGGTSHFPSVPLTRDRDMPIVSVSSTPAQQHGPGNTHNVLRMDHTSRSSATPTVATVGSLSGGATVIAVAARGPGSLPVSSPSLLTSAPTQYHPSVGVSTLVIARQQVPPSSSHARHVTAGHPGTTGTYGLRPNFTASSSVPSCQPNVAGTKLTAVVVGQSQRVIPTPVSVAGGVGGASLTLFPAPIRLQHAQPTPAVSVYPIYSSRPSAPAQQQQQPSAQTNTPVQQLPLPTAPQQQPQQQLPAAAVPGREEYMTAVAPRVAAVAHAQQQQRERELVREEEPRSRTPLTQPHLPTVPRVLTPGLGMAPYDPALHGGGHSHLPSGFSPSLPLRELPTPPPAHQHSPQPEVLRTSHFPSHILHHHQQYFYQQYIRAQQEAALQQAHHSRLYLHPESGTPSASATPAPAAEPPKEERESRDRTPLLPPHLRPSPVPADRSTDSPHLYHRGPTYTPHPHRPYYERPTEEPYPSPPPAHAHSHPAPAPIPPTRTAVPQQQPPPQQQQPVLPPQGSLPPSSAGLPAAHAHSGHGPYAHTPGQSQLPSHPSLGVAMGPAGGPVACTSHSRLHAVRTPPHASQVPPQADSLLSLLQRYPMMWQGQLALKNDMTSVQMHFVSGNPHVARGSLPLQSDGNAVPLRIAQRMRLEQTQLEGVARKMQMEAEHCMLLALPCGRDHMDVLQQSNNLRHGFITYLQLKQAAGIVNVAAPGSQQAAYVVHVFPACDFANENLARIAPDLLHRVADIGHLLVVIATV